MTPALLLLLPAPYAAAGVGYADARRHDESPPRWARLLGVATAIAHLAGLVLLGQATGRSPFHTTSQALSFLGFAVAGLYAVLEQTSRVSRYGAWFYLLAGLLAAASVPGLSAEPLAAPVRRAAGVSLSLHMGFAMLGTAAILASGLLSAGYLGVYRRVKRGLLAVGPSGGPSLLGLQRLARDAAFAGLLLLAPALVLGLHAVMGQTVSGWAHAEIALAFLQFALVLAAWLLWWRRPLRGAVAAWLCVTGMVVAVATFATVHPMLVRSLG